MTEIQGERERERERERDSREREIVERERERERARARDDGDRVTEKHTKTGSVCTTDFLQLPMSDTPRKRAWGHVYMGAQRATEHIHAVFVLAHSQLSLKAICSECACGDAVSELQTLHHS